MPLLGFLAAAKAQSSYHGLQVINLLLHVRAVGLERGVAGVDS
jgi:hypothetical protein